MNFFKKIFNDAQETDNAVEALKDSSLIPPKFEEEEWIWVEGYKGTDKDMKCLGYQYELGVQHNMPDGDAVLLCKSGFHLCLNLRDVYDYYNIGNGNRFFKVKALVRKLDKDRYHTSSYTIDGVRYYVGENNNKLTAKSIVFLSELTSDEILANTEAQSLPEEYKNVALVSGVRVAVETYQISTLVEDGYSLPFATHIVSIDKFNIAHAVGSQKDLSMDLKVLTILYNGKVG